jgi:hypothetical protein
MKAPEKMGAIEVDMQETSREPSQCWEYEAALLVTVHMEGNG